MVRTKESSKISAKDFANEVTEMLRKEGHHPDDGAIVFILSVVPSEGDEGGQHSMKTAVVARDDLWPDEGVVKRILGFAIPHALELIGVLPQRLMIQNLTSMLSVN